MEVAVDIFTGFLDSGKTALITDAIENSDFREGERTILIVCEEGEEEYDEKLLEERGIIKLDLEEEDEFNEYFLEGLELNYRPDHILVEYNGTWGMDTVLETKLPPGWQITGIYSTVDAGTAELYLLNMRTMFLEQVFRSDLVIVNRCTEATDRAKIRRSIKVMNPKVQVIFERENGLPMEEGEETLPFEINADVIEVDEIDYGLWYIDALEHPEHYRDKQIKFLAQVYKGGKLKANEFVPGRFVMTCCEEDIKFLGFLCRCSEPVQFEKRAWVNVVVEYDTVLTAEGNEVPVLELKEIEVARRPKNDVVTFN